MSSGVIGRHFSEKSGSQTNTGAERRKAADDNCEGEIGISFVTGRPEESAVSPAEGLGWDGSPHRPLTPEVARVSRSMLTLSMTMWAVDINYFYLQPELPD